MAASTEAVAEQTEKLHHAAYLLENDTERFTLGYRNGVDSRMNQLGDSSDNKVLVIFMKNQV